MRNTIPKCIKHNTIERETHTHTHTLSLLNTKSIRINKSPFPFTSCIYLDFIRKYWIAFVFFLVHSTCTNTQSNPINKRTNKRPQAVWKNPHSIISLFSLWCPFWPWQWTLLHTHTQCGLFSFQINSMHNRKSWAN